MKTTFIYVLKEPSGAIRYVGKTDNPNHRLSAHVTTKERGHRGNWIRNLRKQGLRPLLEIVDEVSVEHWQQWEVAYIEFFREQGFDLVNETLGGEGTSNWKPSLIWKAKRSLIMRGNQLRKGLPLSETIRKRFQKRFSGHGNPFYGKKHSEEAREKMRVAKLGKSISLEHRLNIGKATKGIPKSFETRRRMKAAWVLRKAKYA